MKLPTCNEGVKYAGDMAEGCIWAMTAGSRPRRRQVQRRVFRCSLQRAAAADDAGLSAMNCLGGRPCSFNPLWPLYLTATTLSPLSAVTSDLLLQLLVFAAIGGDFIKLHAIHLVLDGVQALSIISA